MDGRKKEEREGEGWVMLGVGGIQEWKIGERKKLIGRWMDGKVGTWAGGRTYGSASEKAMP